MTVDPKTMKATELRAALEDRGLSAVGLKAELSVRLQQAIRSDRDQSSSGGTSETTFPFEFGGAIGAAGIMVGLPVVMYVLYFTCGGLADEAGAHEWCLASPFDPAEVQRLRSRIGALPSSVVGELWSWRACWIFATWFAFQVLLERLLPGEDVEGSLLKDGSRLKYRLNGHLAFWVSLLFVATCHLARGGERKACKFPDFGGRDRPSTFLEILYDEYLGLIGASVAFSFLLSVYLYVSSFHRAALLAEGGKSGSPVYDFFVGRELNPRLGSFDLKFFCELRPGLIGWCVLNLGMAAKQAEVWGAVSPSMILLNAFQGLYVWDALFQERALLTTMDITTDGFGFMLAFGDLAWVPFTYSLQARYLVDHDPGLGAVALLAISAITLCGYRFFRGANSQKDAFRRDPSSPSVAHLKYMKTKRGTKLLVSGYWGMARKINYTGDWFMGLSWCMLCGTRSIVPYFYAIYFGVLLVHRAMRDDGFCSEKYGADWLEYKKHVPYIFLPGLI